MTGERILLVEDIGSARESYRLQLESEGYTVTTASNSKEANYEARNICFHVALIDIMLDGSTNTSDRGGVEVVEYLNELDEGTKCIVLSGQPSKSFVRDTFKSLMVYDFIDKQEDLIGKGWNYAFDIIRAAIAECEIDDTPTWQSISANVFCEDEEKLFYDLFSQNIPKIKYGVIQSLLTEAVRSAQPLRRRKEKNKSFEWDTINSVIVAQFWSKAIGCEVRLHISSVDRDAPEDALIYDRKKGGIRAYISRVPDASRDDYY